eukprot:1619083-Prymnesium_polylepis.1
MACTLWAAGNWRRPIFRASCTLDAGGIARRARVLTRYGAAFDACQCESRSSDFVWRRAARRR